MTKDEFDKIWTSNYPKTEPISYLFKHAYPDRWLRIHSLPESKRYVNDENDLKILLTRQNEIITEMFGHNTEVLLITGEFNWGAERKTHITDEEEVFKAYTFTKLDSIDLYKLNSEDYDKGEVHISAFTKVIWKQNLYDNLLRKIADDSIRAFFVSFEKSVIVAPYDGGIDFIIKDNMTKEYYKNKYQLWLSARKDGL